MSAPWLDALVPVKAFASAKERLSPLLTAEERAALARAMLADVLDALQASPEVSRVWVVSPDPDVRALSESLSARPLAEPDGCDGLNGALEAARRDLLRERPLPAPGLLVVPMDLPGADPAAISAFVAESGLAPLVRLCPSTDGGTNALLLRPPQAIPFAFGPDSARLHEQAAAFHGIAFERRVSPSLESDLDWPADLLRLVHGSSGRETTALVARWQLARRLQRFTAGPGS